jgi:DNA damage-binding protein 1
VRTNASDPAANLVIAGSLVMRNTDSETNQIPTLIFGTVSGMIGVLATIPPDMYRFFEQLQQAISKVVRGIGGFQHHA